MYLEYLAITAGLMVAIIAATFMLGRILNNRELEAKARVWVGDFIENIIVLVLILAIYAVSDTVTKAVIASLGVEQYLPDWVDGDGPLEMALSMLPKLVDEMMKLTVLSGEIYHTIELTKNLKENWGFPGVDIYLKFYAAADYYEGPVNWVVMLGSMFYMSGNAQYIALSVIQHIAYPLLAFSLIFRFLNVFRNAANLLIALSLAFTLIYPSLYVIMVALLTHYGESAFGHTPFDVSHAPACSGLFHNFIIRTISLFLPLIPYMGPCILDLFKAVAVGASAILVIPTLLLSITNAFIDALAYMLNLEYRAGMI